jgi:hypothetical protein
VVTTLPAQTTQATVTSTAAPPTTPAPTSPPPTTTPAPTTPPPTPPAAPTTTTGDPTIAELEQQLPPVLIGFLDDVNAAFRDPVNDGLRAALSDNGTGSVIVLMTEFLDRYVAQDEFLRLNPTNPSRVEPILGSIGFAPGTESAGMDACVIDTDVLVRRLADGSEVDVESTPDSFLITYTFVYLDGRWLVESLDVSEQFNDQIGCG